MSEELIVSLELSSNTAIPMMVEAVAQHFERRYPSEEGYKHLRFVRRSAKNSLQVQGASVEVKRGIWGYSVQFKLSGQTVLVSVHDDFAQMWYLAVITMILALLTAVIIFFTMTSGFDKIELENILQALVSFVVVWLGSFLILQLLSRPVFSRLTNKEAQEKEKNGLYPEVRDIVRSAARQA